MELITFCGLIIVVLGLWAEFKLAAKAVVKIFGTRSLKDDHTAKAVQQTVTMSRMPICLANFSHYLESA